MSICNFEHVSKFFSNRKLLDNVSFTLNAGEITTLIGQNGAGKTTIAKMLLGIEKPTSGHIKIKKNLKFGYLPQKINYARHMPLDCNTLAKMLAPTASEVHFEKYKEFIDYQEIKNTDIHNLSGGQMQKLLLVCSILDQPDLLILDEPTQYLDVNSQQQFYRLIKEYVDNSKNSIFIISHDLFTVMKNTDQVLCINGHICCSGRPSEISSNSELKNALSEIGLYVHQHDHEHN